jgi:hypothetical protein
MTHDPWTEGGHKFDSGKPPLSLLDPYALTEVAKVLAFGAGKYDKHNWRRGISYSRLMDAALRHLMDFNNGEDLDPESKLSHIAHASCCLMFLLWMVQHRSDLDDRYDDDQAYLDRIEAHLKRELDAMDEREKKSKK